MENYELLKSLHLLGVILFLGNIIVTAFWKMLADRTRSPVVIAFSQRLVTITDFAFTVTGVLLIAITGRMMASSFGEISDSLWLIWGWGLFAASGLIWVLILLPVQIKQSKLAKEFDKNGTIPDSYWKLSKYWAGFGIIATVLPLINLYFMVFKPT